MTKNRNTFNVGLFLNPWQPVFIGPSIQTKGNPESQPSLPLSLSSVWASLSYRTTKW